MYLLQFARLCQELIPGEFLQMEDLGCSPPSFSFHQVCSVKLLFCCLWNLLNWIHQHHRYWLHYKLLILHPWHPIKKTLFFQSSCCFLPKVMFIASSSTSKCINAVWGWRDFSKDVFICVHSSINPQYHCQYFCPSTREILRKVCVPLVLGLGRTLSWCLP